MGRVQACRGRMTQAHHPRWTPLLTLVGEDVIGDFMWMFEVELADGTALQAYKHIDTRRYVHLDPDGAAFVFQAPDRYRRVQAADVLAAVFAPLPGLVGVTTEQMSAARAVLDRLRALG